MVASGTAYLVVVEVGCTSFEGLVVVPRGGRPTQIFRQLPHTLEALNIEIPLRKLYFVISMHLFTYIIFLFVAAPALGSNIPVNSTDHIQDHGPTTAQFAEIAKSADC